MALLKINGVDMPDPTTYSVPMADMESSDSAYSESGIRIRNLIRPSIIRLELGWCVTGDKAVTILNAIDPSSADNRKVSVEYLDPRTGTRKTADMFVEDRSCNLLLYGSETDATENLWEIGFNLVQY